MRVNAGIVTRVTREDVAVGAENGPMYLGTVTITFSGNEAFEFWQRMLDSRQALRIHAVPEPVKPVYMDRTTAFNLSRVTPFQGHRHRGSAYPNGG
jgi:hypothetical protein